MILFLITYLHQLKKNLAEKSKHAQVDEINATTSESFKTLDDASNPSDSEGCVTAVVAKVKYQATESQARRKDKHPRRCCTGDNIIRVLLDSGSDGDLLFHEKGTPMHFPHLTRQVPLSWHTSDVSFLIKGRSNCCLDIF
jgi:hypothetical protein